MEWFLIYKNEHLGPYTKEYLLSLFNDGLINRDSIVWKEGWDESQSFEEAFLLNEEQKVFQPIVHNIESIDIKSSENVIKDEDLPPDLPFDVATVSPPDIPQDIISRYTDIDDSDEVRVEYFDEKTLPEPEEYGIELEELNHDEFSHDDFEQVESKEHSRVKYAYLFAIVLLIAIPSFFYYSAKPTIFSRPESMSVKTYDFLKDVTLLDASELKFRYSLSKDKSKIWISTNHPLSGEVFISLRSISSMSLGDPVEIKAKGYLKDHFIDISEYNFLQGSKLVDGFYNIEIYTAQNLKVPLLGKFRNDWDQQFRFLEENLISSMTKFEFNKIIQSKNAVIEKNEKNFFTELIEQYRTVKTITTEIRNGINKIFSTAVSERDAELTAFEAKYKTKYGVFFTSFVISVDEKYDEVINQEFENKLEIIAHYNKLRELAEKIGAESVARLEDLKSVNFEEVDELKVNNIKFKSVMNFNEIILECSSQLEKLTE